MSDEKNPKWAFSLLFVFWGENKLGPRFLVQHLPNAIE